MATGSYDSTGIWQTGEDDPLAPFSTFMNKLSGSVTAVLGGAWGAHTPTITNLTLGNGTVSAQLKKVGRIVYYRGRCTIGSTTVFPGGSPTLALPHALASFDDRIPLGSAEMVDIDVLKYMSCTVRAASTTTAAFHSPAGYLFHAAEPFTWAVGDSFGWNMTYPSAT